MELINMTPHAVTIIQDTCVDGVACKITIPSSGIARASVTSTFIAHPVNDMGIPVVKSVYGEVQGLPPETDDVYIIVSGLVLDHPSTSHRRDLLAPGELVRDDKGQPIGCMGLRALR